ncbi:MAG: hypothetical protein ACKO3Q_05730, partial [Betaproteobacteria bacterium]
DNFSSEWLGFTLTEFSLEDVLPESVYSLIEPFVDTESDTVEFELPTVDLGVVGPAIGDLPYFEKSVSIDLGGEDEPLEFGIKVGAGWKDTTLADMLLSDPVPAGIVPLDLGVRFQSPGIAITVPMLDIGPYTLQGPALDIELILPEVDLPYLEYQQALGKLNVQALQTGETLPVTQVDWGLELALGWKDMQLTDLVDMEAWREGDFSVAMPEMDLRLYVELPEGEDLPEIKAFLPQYFDIALPSFKATILGKELAIGFGTTIRYETPEAYADYIDTALASVKASLPGIDIDAAIDLLLDGDELDAQALKGLLSAPSEEAIEVDLTDLDSVNDAFELLIQVIPERFKIADPTISGKIFGVTIDQKIPLSKLAPELVEFSLSEILPESVYQIMEPFIRPMGSDEDPVLITLPELQLPDIGPSVPFVEQFVDMLKTMPSQVRLYNPTVSAALLGISIEQTLPLTEVVQLVADELGIELFSVEVNEDEPSESYIEFSILEVMDQLPESLKDILGYLIDDAETEEGEAPKEPMALRAVELDLGDFTPQGMQQYVPYVKLGTALLNKLGLKLPFLNLDPQSSDPVAEAETGDAGGDDLPPVVEVDNGVTWVTADNALTPVAAVNEVQTLSLAIDASLGLGTDRSFKLALGKSKVTDAIAVLPVGGSAVAEQQQITVLQSDVNKRFALKIGNWTSSDIVYSGNPEFDAKKIADELAKHLDIASAKVRYGTDAQSRRTFTIYYVSEATAAPNLAQLQVVPGSAGKLAFASGTLRDGSAASTAANQAALIQAALDKTLGAGLITVSTGAQGNYLLTMGGRYAHTNLDQLQVSDATPGVKVSTATQTEGKAATGPSYLIDLQASADQTLFDLRLT